MHPQRSSLHPRVLPCVLAVVLSAVSAAPAAAQIATPNPVVERLEPNFGPPGTVVQMVGRHFRSDQIVSVGGVAMEVRTRLPNRWTVVIPAGATTGPITIRLADGTTLAGPELRVTAALPPPTVTSIAPTTATPGSEVRIVGTGFSPRLADDTVTLNGASLVVRSASPTELVVVVPPDAATGALVVRVAGAGEATTPALTITAGLTITSFAPTTAAPGMEVTVTGTGFDARRNRNRVSIGGVSARVVSGTATSLVVVVPATAATGAIVVEPRGGGRATSSASLVVRAMPTLGSLEPTSGTVGASIRIRGTGFGSDIRAVSVSIGGVAMTVRGVTDTEVTVDIPAGATTGPVSVTTAGLPAVVSGVSLAVLVPVSLASFAPTSGPVGTEVTVAGAGFSTVLAENRVTLAGAACTTVAASPTELRVRVPATSSGPLVVEVSGAGSARTSQPFVITTPPTVASFEPAQGTAGTVVRITGTNFGTSAGLLDVTVGGVRMEIRSVTPTAIEAAVPATGASGPIAVTVRLQGSATSSASFRVLADFAVVGAEALTGYPGQRVTVRGRGFGAGTTARFAGTSTDASVTVISTTELRAVVPEGASTGVITVHVEDGREATMAFTLAPDPAGTGIGDVAPTCTGRQCTVLVYGWGFGTSARALTATVHGRAARVRRVSAHFLELTVPRAAGTGVVHLVVRGGPTVDSAEFAIE